jgi:hypothetical protein
MGHLANLLRAATSLAFAAAAGALPACGGGDGTDAAVEAHAVSDVQAALQGVRVSAREQALQIAARAVVAPLRLSELAHAALVRAFELRAITHGAEPAASAGDGWMLDLHAQPLGARARLEGRVTIAIETTDHAEGLLLRGEAGFVRALLRFDHAALGVGAHIDGELVVEVSRTEESSDLRRRSQADALSVTDGSQTLRWSYLNVEADAAQMTPTLTVVSDVPLDGAANVWLDVTTRVPGRLAAAPGRYVASGVIGFLRARLTLEPTADGGWTIGVDNDQDDRVDFIVQASADDVGARMAGL